MSADRLSKQRDLSNRIEKVNLLTHRVKQQKPSRITLALSDRRSENRTAVETNSKNKDLNERVRDLVYFYRQTDSLRVI